MTSPQEVIPLIKQVYFENPDLKIPERYFQNILYKLKRELPDEPILKELYFFWYVNGPQSDTITNAIEIMKYKKDVSSTTPYLVFKEGMSAQKDAVNNNIVDTMRSILNGYDSTSICRIMWHVFQKYAPFAFMHSFRVNFLTKLAMYTNSIIPQTIQDECLINPYTICDLDSLRKNIYQCIIELPSEALYEPFNRLFSTYVTSIIRLFDYTQNYDENVTFLRKAFDVGHDGIWNTFVNGVRISDEEGQEYYSSKLKEWTGEYNKSLFDLKPLVYEFKSQILEKVRYNLPCSMDETQKKILSSIIEGYYS